MVENRIKEALLRTGLSLNKAVVIGSGIMCALGIRESHDIDVVLPIDEFNKLAQNQNFVQSKKFNDTYFQGMSEDIEVWPYWWNFKEDSIIPYDVVRENSIIIDGVRYVSLPFLRQWKTWRSREKDLADVKLIDAYMGVSDE